MSSPGRFVKQYGRLELASEDLLLFRGAVSCCCLALFDDPNSRLRLNKFCQGRCEDTESEVLLGSSRRWGVKWPALPLSLCCLQWWEPGYRQAGCVCSLWLDSSCGCILETCSNFSRLNWASVELLRTYLSAETVMWQCPEKILIRKVVRGCKSRNRNQER